MDLADSEDGSVLWSSNSRRPDLDDCYLYEDEDTVRLYEGKLDKTLGQFDPRAGDSYWVAEDFTHDCYGGYEVLVKKEGGLRGSR